MSGRLADDVLVPVLEQAERLSIPLGDIVTAIQDRTPNTKGRN